MHNTDFTQYDILPKEMMNYLAYNGPHFTKELCDFAVSKMEDKNGKLEPYSKKDIDTFLHRNNITLKHNQLYDYVYVANMCKADYLYSSIIDENHLALFVKDTIDDPDGYDGIVFNRWFADMSKKGIAIDWAEMI